MPRRYGRRANMRRYAKKKTSKAPWYARKYSAMDAGRYALSQVWKLKGLVNSEMYKYDLVNNSLSPSTTGTVTHLTGVSQGDGDGNRTGNSIFARSLNIKGYVQRNAAGSSTQIIKIALVMDKQQVGDSAPTWSDIYEGTDVNSHLNSDTVGRFSILYTRQLICDSVSSPVVRFDINKAMRHHVRFNGSNGTDIQKGGIYLVCVSTQSSANFPAVSFDSRLSYHDN